MKLWTIQNPETINQIEKTGTYTCKANLCKYYKDNWFKDSYDWLISEMNKRGIIESVVKPTVKTVGYKTQKM